MEGSELHVAEADDNPVDCHMLYSFTCFLKQTFME